MAHLLLLVFRHVLVMTASDSTLDTHVTLSILLHRSQLGEKIAGDSKLSSRVAIAKVRAVLLTPAVWLCPLQYQSPEASPRLSLLHLYRPVTACIMVHIIRLWQDVAQYNVSAGSDPPVTFTPG